MINGQKKKAKTSIIIPCYNEKKYIQTILDRVSNINISKEIIVVNDGSNDGTLEILDNLADKGIRVINKEKNEGKGAAIRTGISESTGDYVVVQDADLEYDPQDIPKLLEHLEKNNLSVVYGSRVKSNSAHSSAVFYAGGKLLSWITNLIYGSNITDEPTCYKMFRSSLIKKIKLNCSGFEFCPEVTAKVLRLGHNIEEIPISYTPRSKKDGKKIKWRDGVIAIWVLVKYKFVRLHKLTDTHSK
jgi:dolichol-phosphate mannosyltransferase